MIETSLEWSLNTGYTVYISQALRGQGLNGAAKSTDPCQAVQSLSSRCRIKLFAFVNTLESYRLFKPLPDDKILDWSKLKQIEDDISKCI